jgi:hypothetical protein
MTIARATSSPPAHSTLDPELMREATLSVVRAVACLPFDAMRAAYATTVQRGLAQSSPLASRDFEAMVHALEGIFLGPVARRR